MTLFLLKGKRTGGLLLRSADWDGRTYPSGTQSARKGLGKKGNMMGRKGNSGMRSAILLSIESRIRSDPTETAALVAPNGDIIFDKSDGLVGAVNFTEDECAKMVDATLTHNHPGGTTFSSNDIDLAVARGLKEIRAVHTDGSYSLTRQYKIGDDIPEHYLSFSSDYRLAVTDYMISTVDAIYAQTGDADKCNGMVASYRRQWLTQNSASYGWKYKEGN